MNDNTLNDEINYFIIELDTDAVGLWQIYKRKGKYNLSDNEFMKFMHGVIVSLMENGAVPVISQYSKKIIDYDWEEINSLGILPKDIADNIVAKWSKENIENSIGNIETSIFNLNGVWFKKPNNYVKLLENNIVI